MWEGNFDPKTQTLRNQKEFMTNFTNPSEGMNMAATGAIAALKQRKKRKREMCWLRLEYWDVGYEIVCPNLVK